MSTIPPWQKKKRVKHRSPKARTKSNSPVPESERGEGKRVYRRNYLVNRLPPSVQARVFDWYARGVPYHKMSERLAKLGHRINPHALGRYWRHVWHEEHEDLIAARGLLVVFKKAFRLPAKSQSSEFASEMLYSMLLSKVKEMRAKDPEVLLAQAREQEKRGGGEQRNEGRGKKRSAAAEAKEVRRRWRELYGMNEDEGEEDKE